MGKAQIIRRIHHAAVNYRTHFVGYTYMFIYEKHYVEVMFKKSSFMHLTGVASKLKPVDFYKHALAKSGLRPSEISFNSEHPFDLADKKTQCLSDLHEITHDNVVVATDIVTMTFTYAIGITNLKFVICLGNDTDDAGNLKSNCMIPYSFRIEEIESSKFDRLYEVTHIFKKNTGERKYNELMFGNVEQVKDLPPEIQEKIELNFTETQ